MTVVAAVVVVMLIVVLLSIDSIGEMFKQRASLGQSYDSGRFGRFGRHILGAEMALDLPFGIGPLQFNRYFPEDTHNSYPERVHVGRLDRRRLLSRAGAGHRDHGLPARCSSGCRGSAPISPYSPRSSARSA